MNLVQWIRTYTVAIILFLSLDMLWLGMIAKGFYSRNMAQVVEMRVSWLPAILFYTIYVIGILIFGVRPALVNHSFRTALVWGGLFGFFTYATYDLTNLATVKGWPVRLALVDILWGTFLGAIVAAGALLAAAKKV